MDFADPKNPIVEKIPFHFSTCGHALCIVNTGGSHADLNDEYGAVRSEMEAVAQYFGVSALRGTSKEAVIKNMPALRKQVGDRAVLRALHFFNDNARVDAQAAALRDDDFAAFKQLVIKSGYSSYMFNQNVYLGSTPHLQPISVALALCEELLAGTGAWRVHGGGFAGTVQAYVPNELLDDFKAKTEAVFGAGSCYVLQVRQQGGACVGI
jgi:galactokinase